MRKRPLLLMSVVFALGFFCLAYPLYVIRPFRHQGPRELNAALQVAQYRPGTEIVCVVLAAVLLFFTWQKETRVRRCGMAFLATLVVTCGLLSRINVYEKMFHPLDAPSFSAAGQAKLAAAEQVIAIRVNKQARAYPIRDISYHHIVNDTLGGRAIVATY